MVRFVLRHGEELAVVYKSINIAKKSVWRSFLRFSVGVWALSQTIHKYYVIRDKKAIAQGVIVSTVFALVVGFDAYFSGALSYFFPETVELPSEAVMPNMLKIAIPVGLTGRIGVLVWYGDYKRRFDVRAHRRNLHGDLDARDRCRQSVYQSVRGGNALRSV